MNRVLIPSLLAVTVLIAGIFAFSPIEEASTVHTTILANQVQVVELGIITPGDMAAGVEYSIDCDAAYRVVGITFDLGAGDYIGADEFDVTVGGDNYIDDIQMVEGAVELLDGSQIAAVATDDVLINTLFNIDDGTEDIENARASVITSGSCTFTDVE